MAEGVFGPYAGVVDLVHDGDTVNVRLDVGFDLTVYARVRIYGINAPELSTDAGKVARDFAQSIVGPKPV
jgi:endonuclease YncB( thermonuclease family)